MSKIGTPDSENKKVRNFWFPTSKLLILSSLYNFELRIFNLVGFS